MIKFLIFLASFEVIEKGDQPRGSSFAFCPEFFPKSAEGGPPH
jgi:hypothetical protein